MLERVGTACQVSSLCAVLWRVRVYWGAQTQWHSGAMLPPPGPTLGLVMRPTSQQYVRMRFSTILRAVSWSAPAGPLISSALACSTEQPGGGSRRAASQPNARPVLRPVEGSVMTLNSINFLK